MSTHLELYLDLLKGLPNDVARNLSLIQVLDEKTEEIKKTIDSTSKEIFHLTNITRKLTPEETENLTKLLSTRRSLERAIYNNGLEKVALIKQNENILKTFTDKLDEELKKFEAELDPDIKLAVLEEEAGTLHEEPQIPVRASSVQKSQINKRPREEPVISAPVIPVDESMLGAGTGETYCFCGSVSTEMMIGCDNDNCRLQWFHLTCVGLKKAPSGTWYCNECSGKGRYKTVH